MRNLYNTLQQSGIYMLLSLFTFLTACQDESYSPKDLVSDVTWYTSETVTEGQTDTLYFVNEGSFVSFMDLSQGVKSHQWIIEEGAHFLNDNFNSKLLPFASQIDPNKSFVSNNKVESVYFGKAGLTKVTLLNTFWEWVKSHNSNPIEAVLGDQEWVFTKEFKVRVFGALQPAYKVVNAAGDVILQINETDSVNEDKSTWLTYELTVGEPLTLIDMTQSNNPSARTWMIPGSAESSSEDSVATFSFNTLNGNFSNLSILAKRTFPASSTKKLIPLVIKTVASSDPFIAKTEKIRVDPKNPRELIVEANGAFAGVGDLAATAFTLTAATANGTVLPIAVQAVSVDLVNPSLLRVALSDQLYPGEILTLAYNGSGDITSLDQRTLEAFSTTPVVNELVGGNILPKQQTHAQFETENINSCGGWRDNKFVNYINLAASPTGDGKSLFIDQVPSLEMLKPAIILYQTGHEIINLPAGSFSFSFDMYIDPSLDLPEGKCEFQIHDGKGWNIKAIYFNYPELVGQWVKVNVPVNVPAPIAKAKLQLKFDSQKAKPGEFRTCKYFVDNLSLEATRPL